MWQVTYAFLFQALTDLVEAIGSGGYAGVLDTAWMGLYIAPTGAIGPQTAMSAITEANYDGYARQRPVWFPPIQSSQGPEVVYGQNLFFSPTDALVVQNILGIFLASAAYGGTLYAGQQVPAPGIQLVGPATGIVVKPVFELPTTLVYGGADIES